MKIGKENNNTFSDRRSISDRAKIRNHMQSALYRKTPHDLLVKEKRLKSGLVKSSKVFSSLVRNQWIRIEKYYEFTALNRGSKKGTSASHPPPHQSTPPPSLPTGPRCDVLKNIKGWFTRYRIYWHDVKRNTEELLWTRFKRVRAFQMELEFGRTGFWGEGRTGAPGEKLLGSPVSEHKKSDPFFFHFGRFSLLDKEIKPITCDV